MGLFFDMNDGDFCHKISDNMYMDSDGDMMMKMSDNIGMDMDTGEMHFLIGDSETKIDEGV